MAFFDRLGKTVTEVGQKTLARTKELADTSRLNTMISEEEKIITNQYFQIGRLYVSLHKEDYEDDFLGMINSIAEAEEKIANYRKQIQEIKGVQRCENCGAEVPNGAAFCSACGATMPKIQMQIPPDCVKCENCGANVKKGMRFCTSCGNPMGTITTKETEVQEVQERYCPNCGAKLDAGVVFCTECGTNLQNIL